MEKLILNVGIETLIFHIKSLDPKVMPPFPSFSPYHWYKYMMNYVSWAKILLVPPKFEDWVAYQNVHFSILR